MHSMNVVVIGLHAQEAKGRDGLFVTAKTEPIA